MKLGFPIFVIQTERGGTCGHQHATPSRARNCGRNYLHRNRQVRDVSVVKIRPLADGGVKQTHIITVDRDS